MSPYNLRSNGKAAILGGLFFFSTGFRYFPRNRYHSCYCLTTVSKKASFNIVEESKTEENEDIKIILYHHLHLPPDRSEASECIKRASNACSFINAMSCFGAPRGIRTPDPQFRKLLLYPAELWMHSVTIITRFALSIQAFSISDAPTITP